MLRKLLGLGPKADIASLLANGALVVDVRTRTEYGEGHVEGSVNIPVDNLLQNLHALKKDRPVITCCASGMRSASAATLLRDNGFDAHNGGPWTKVRAILDDK